MQIQEKYLSNPHGVIQLLPSADRRWRTNLWLRMSNKPRQLCESDRLVLEELRGGQSVFSGTVLRARFLAGPNQHGIPGVLLAFDLGITWNLVSEKHLTLR